AESQVVWQIQGLVGRQAAEGIQAVLEGTRHTTHGIIATGIGLLTLLFGASGVLMELRDALNTIWEIPPAQTTGLRTSCRWSGSVCFLSHGCWQSDSFCCSRCW